MHVQNDGAAGEMDAPGAALWPMMFEPAEGELHVPRLGRVEAAPGFRVVAAMNPFDAVGTARISSAVYDRVCRVAMGYQGAGEEAEIVAERYKVTREAQDELAALFLRTLAYERAAHLVSPDAREFVRRARVQLQQRAAAQGRPGRPASAHADDGPEQSIASGISPQEDR